MSGASRSKRLPSLRRARRRQGPSITDQANPRQQALEVIERRTLVVDVEAPRVPGLAEGPALVQRHGSCQLLPGCRHPGTGRLLRPEEQDAASGEDDVVPPLPCWPRQRDDSIPLDEAATGYGQFPAVATWASAVDDTGLLEAK